jgi:hypothetical protein
MPVILPDLVHLTQVPAITTTVLQLIRIPQVMEQETVIRPTIHLLILPAAEAVAAQIITTITEIQVRPLTTPMDRTRQIPPIPALTVMETTTLVTQVVRVTLPTITPHQTRITALIRTVQ